MLTVIETLRTLETVFSFMLKSKYTTKSYQCQFFSPSKVLKPDKIFPLLLNNEIKIYKQISIGSNKLNLNIIICPP